MLERKLVYYSENYLLKDFQLMRGFCQLKGRKPNSKPDGLDVENDPIYEFRIDGKFRVMGYLFKHIFYIVWLDPDHELTD